ncbi:MAG: hypothetical protein HY265_08060 [Deltaproteobacteria bacterium]|nr:hypothetical protein [Deltaproteobacteria bacterium]MBI3756096.1 hypothetical protein [Deltaproteobacteria bacterium]
MIDIYAVIYVSEFSRASKFWGQHPLGNNGVEHSYFVDHHRYPAVTQFESYSVILAGKDFIFDDGRENVAGINIFVNNIGSVQEVPRLKKAPCCRHNPSQSVVVWNLKQIAEC